MTLSKKLVVSAVAVTAIALALAGCSRGGGGTSTGGTDGGDAANSDIKICVYTHGDGGTFWAVAQKGAEDAAADLGVTLDYQGSTNDAQKQASTIQAGIEGGCDGIAASAPDPDAIESAMLAAADAGIPTVTINSGSAVFQDLGAFTHVGQDEVVAGEQAGLRFNEIGGVTKILCPIQEAANVGLVDRCTGLANTFDGEVVQFNADGALADLSGAEAKIEAALVADPDINGIFALNADVATGAAIPAVESAGRDITVGTVDLSGDALDAIEDGTLAFAIDQQQYGQGYQSVVLLYLAIKDAIELGGGLPINTGPAFIDADNLDAVRASVEAGTR